MAGLDDYRVEIDEIDKELVGLIDKRMRVAEKIGRYKKENNLPVLDLARERTKLDKITDMAKDDMASYTRLLYNLIMDMSKDYQRKCNGFDSSIVLAIEKALEETNKVLPKRPVVACQGVEGAYSQQACDKIFDMAKVFYMKNFNGVFKAINEGLCTYGVLPLENSTAGSVNQVYDLMMKYNFHIVKSVKLKVDHCLLATKGIKKEDIKEIFSHEQAIMQCDEYLKEMTGVKVTVCENTAVAAEKVAKSGRNDVAAIASLSCGEIYGLECVEEDIQDNGNNYTRFICIGKKLEIYPGSHKTSIMMTLPHKPGSLYNVLSRFYTLGINITKLESRPIPGKDFDFMFYFDIDVPVYSEEFIRLISELESLSKEFRYLGSYSEL